jgi:hypothetical protein
MSVHLRILVLLARRRRIRLPPIIVFQGKAFVLFRRASVRTSCILRRFRIRRRVWLSFLIVRSYHRMLGARIRTCSCCRPL